MSEDGIQRRLSAILAADVVGYSALMEGDEAGTLSALKVLRRDVFDPEIASCGGRIVKLMGDGALVEFPSVVDAVEAALAIQKNLQAANDPALRLRMGINLGDVIVEGDDIYGGGVNVAARLEALAPAGGICISAIVQESIGAKVAELFQYIGLKEVKNLERPLHVYCWPADSVARSPEQTTVPPLPEKPSIAVLPFDNMSGDPDQEYFSDGITEDIITGLSRFHELIVIARNSTFTYKGQPVNVQDVGRALGVRYIVEGSVRKAGNRVRVTVQLIEAANGSHVWAERYDRVIEDVFEVQDQITTTIIASVVGRVEARRISNTRKSETSNLTAFDHVLHGRHEIHYYTPESLAKARHHLTHAVAIDPDYAAAHLSLSQAYWGEWWTGATPDPAGWFEHMFKHAERALRLDDADARVHLQIGFVELYRRRYGEGRSHLEKALRLNANDPNIPFCLAFLEVFEGNGGAATDWVDCSIRMNPLGHYGYILGQAHYVARDYERSIAALQTVRPGMLSAGAWLAACHAQLGNQNEASEIMARFASHMSSAITDAGGKLPDSWCDYFTERWPFRHTHDLDHLLDGFRMAGLV